MSLRLASIFRLCVAASALVPIQASTVIFSDFGPGGTYDPSRGFYIAGIFSPTDTFASWGMPFTPSGEFLLNQIDIAVETFPESTLPVIVTLDANSAGTPGSALMTWTVTALPPSGTCCSAAMLEASSPLFLSAGTQYWVVASPESPQTFAEWNWNSIGVTGPQALQEGPGLSWIVSNFDPPGAFAVSGTPVPEPATGRLAGASLIAIIIFAVGRKRLRKLRSLGCCP